MGAINAWEQHQPSFRFDPLDPEYLANPYPFLAEAASAAAPVFYCEAIDYWIVTRYHDIQDILRSPALFSAVNADWLLFTPCPMATRALDDGGLGSVPTLTNVDPATYDRVRKIANVAFAPKRVAEMEPFVRDLTARFCAERLGDGQADMVRDFAWTLPALALFRILGVPDDELPRVNEGSWRRILLIYGRPSEAEQANAMEGLAAFWQFAESLVRDRIQKPRQDFVSELVNCRDAKGQFLAVEQSATVMLNLLFAGHEATTGLLGNLFRRLLADRSSWEAICREPKLIPGAVEEVLRLDSSVITRHRRTTQEVDIAGVHIPTGARLLLLLGAANRDPSVFSEPNRFDIRRPNARAHLSFGSGPQFCLGASLVRLQGKVVLEEMSTRIPNLRLVPGVERKFAPNVSFHSPLSLPVEWGETASFQVAQ
ncbi:MAG: cytochrome P450 [Beijerinckiaceae bacterium]